MIPVTKPFLPKVNEFEEYIHSIWERQWLTNNGPLVNELELKLKNYLEIKHLLFVSNGTIALQIAIKALGLTGEIITTPFSFVATTNSIVWEGCKPVFVDIDEETFNIDPKKIEAAITPQTSAILATHVYGNPCDIDAIQEIADRYSLKVIYDAAHCFGTKYKNKSVFAYGDVSTTSFHATKVFHTIEGGAVFTQCPDLLKKMALMRNFGHDGPDEFSELGINGKNCEFHAAMGLCNLKEIDEILDKRRLLSFYYWKALANLEARYPKLNENLDYNYAYFPVLFDSEDLMLRCLKALENEKVYCRRYFYPSLSTLPFVTSPHMPVCDSVSRRILCLPLYHTLTSSDLDLITRIILRVQNYDRPAEIERLNHVIPINNLKPVFAGLQNGAV
ncbi:DegT/DnrJ/EryC1/StrS family aminotransferase [Pedobacter panaciterrae]|jgi:Predicted pyridoxal phosphate-dependent enzyme apparently involved in regulation of cell wall biogenesis|uniref:DegT/DnrJ/EryC1/StrS family aminotransferase n=1 Tax=Pedobacter panaciterrae TaxID=363849 RepID=A0ABU8NJ30_9SPHI|nr:DegT/DnrJ/EryC1/StrS family aminotransferase [Pedobacter panaciterrae]NQX55839.1 DegT/DnrJ/EryC1/StrS family aminotransferase [Pedobacter panaciterrae]